MKIHEYQARDLLAKFGIPVTRGHVAATPAEAETIAKEIGARVVVKAQVLVGGRGKAGGVKLADDAVGARRVAEQILGMDIKGITVEQVLVAEAVNIAQELYLAATLDRASRRVVLMGSAAGGMDIEEVAATAPEKILKLPIDPALGVLDFQAREMAFAMGLDAKQARQFTDIAKRLYSAMREQDATLAEINPLAVSPDGSLRAVDAKMILDDNADFRHPDFESLRTSEEETEAEREARQAGLNFVQLDGEVGCLVNGAGLAMATMDLVNLYGGKPANFCDMAGGARADHVRNGLRIVLMDPSVKVILFNIFGGITRCDEVARGIVDSLPAMSRPVPVVVRLIGTNSDIGNELLRQNNVATAEKAEDAARLAVEASRA
ncbi:MAG: ADP-forming succinate--CoA ligase subunit beta [Chloroflexi bacterium]|nr:ADP-forming succinate--CoA ligase subunit beta [Chloroflexota bacterium]